MIKKALITSAGFGTRLLPVTKTIQKEMLPILNRPIIDYLVNDCVSAGIEEIIFVVKEGENNLVKHFYTENESLEKHLIKMGKLEKNIHHLQTYKDTKFSFVIQKVDDKYGTAIPLQLAKDHLENEDAFLVFMGDEFIYNSNNKSEVREMISMFEQSGAKGLVSCAVRPDEELYRYGVAEVREKNGYNFLTNLVEKPEPGTAPSNLANISKYIFTPDIFEIIENQEPNQSNGEYYITDSATELSKKHDVCIYTPDGRYLDGGNLLGWLKANLVVAKDDPEINDQLREIIKEEFNL